MVYVAIGLSGLCALAAESIWTRMLGLLLGASVYTLSIILVVFLAGLGIGSSIGSHALSQSRASARRSGLVPAASCRRNCLDRIQSCGIAAVLAGQSIDLLEHLVQLSARSGSSLLGSAPANDALGRQLSSGTGIRRI